MIKLDSIELEKVKGNANSVAQALVKKAIEEEMKIRPFSEEELGALSEMKKNVEIEYFLNLLAQNKITVSEVEILEAYKNNLAAFGDKNVTEIYSQLHQLVFNQKLGAEKATIVNNLVSKYGLNDVLKEYVPELKNLAKDENNNETFVAKEESTIVSEKQATTFENNITNETIIPQPFVKEEEPVKETAYVESIIAEETVVSSPFIINEESLVTEAVSEGFSIYEEPTKEEVFRSEPVKDEPIFGNITPEPFVIEETIQGDVSHISQEGNSEKSDEVLSTPFVALKEDPVQNNFIEETSNLFEAPQTTVEPEISVVPEIKSETIEKEKDESSNEPFSFGNFNFKFD
ncbi:hypothetical protein [Fusobacterium sp. PH5-44]|uniref:hypothetical protein n=1 Tax=unclassified Fusobacterium TaxID=2648384 RepID=UPI003D1FCB2A